MQESVFWRVLAALARNGYAVPPSDARDLIHDFYLDAWNGINERFDPALGSFASYIATAFYRFARRRILKLESIQHRMVDFESVVAELSTWKTPADILEAREQLQAVNAAVAQLTPLEQEVLDGFLSGAQSSERQLALRHALSRYGLREVLVDSVGKVAVTLGRSGSSSKTEETIAELLWKYGQTPRNVANLLGIPVAEVQGARSRFVAALLSSIRKSERPESLGRFEMKHEDALQLLKSALFSVGNEDVLRDVRAHARDIQQALEEGDVLFEESQWSLVHKHPAWVAAIYDSLADSKGQDDDVSDLSRAIDSIRDNEQREIGEAFAALVTALPGEFREWEKNRFVHVKPANKDYQQELLSRPSVRAAGEVSFGLVRYGLAPESIYGATRGLELLFNRIERSNRAASPSRNEPQSRTESVLPVPVYLVLGPSRAPVEVAEKLIFAEVAATPDLPEGAGVPLTWWIFAALQFRPYLIQGYTAYFDNEKFAFRWIGVNRESADRRSDLIARWSRLPDSRESGYQAAV